MDVHILNGDALAEKFILEGDVIIFRECLIDGPVQAPTLEDFFFDRAAFISETFDASAEEYFTKVKPEIDRIENISITSPINLWFEHDLFCQVNAWFLIDLLSSKNLTNNLYMVMPAPANTNDWSGFGNISPAGLKMLYNNRIKLSSADVKLGCDLWNAYRKNNLTRMIELSSKPSDVFPRLASVIKAHADRYPTSGLGRPQQMLRSIIGRGTQDFHEIFKKFSETEAIYGFGDAQVRKMLSRL